ncbi:MAG: protein-export chaperone SecB [Marinisporobacter sp.]|nr:protein-export chaperone SecB [Marinisporobacter sp.]
MKESKFQLIGKPRVTKSLFEISEKFDSDGELTLEIENNVKIIQAENDIEAMVILTLEIFKTNDFEKVPFKMDMTIEGHFGWSEELKDNKTQLEVMLKENAPAILYSYLRPLITLLTVEGNLPPLVIPLMNFRD